MWVDLLILGRSVRDDAAVSEDVSAARGHGEAAERSGAVPRPVYLFVSGTVMWVSICDRICCASLLANQVSWQRRSGYTILPEMGVGGFTLCSGCRLYSASAG